LQIDYGYTSPPPIRRGEYQQLYNRPMGAEETPATAPGQVQPPSGQQPELLPAPPPSPRVEQSMLSPPGQAAPRGPVPPSGAAAASPGGASHDLGAMDLSGLAATRQPPPAEPGRLDMSGFAPLRPAASPAAIQDAAVQPAGY
jgi:hypothetical protein